VIAALVAARHRDAVSRYGVLVAVLVAVVAGGEALAPSTLEPSNLAAMAQFTVPFGLMAFGEMFVILGGGGAIDLSIGGVFPLAAVVTGKLLLAHAPIWLAIALGLFVGVGAGVLNGLVVVGLGIPAILVTLATLYGFSGLAYVIANGVSLSGFGQGFFKLGGGTVGGVPLQFLCIYVPIVIVVWYATTRSVFAYRVRLSGTNPVAAFLSGIDVRSTRFKAYVVSGFLAALAGIIEASFTMTSDPSQGGLDAVFVVVTIVVLGGIDLSGGEGTVGGVVLATLTLGLLGYSFDLANKSSVLETGLVGVVLLVAIVGRLVVTAAYARAPRRAQTKPDEADAAGLAPPPN
jgi:ribose/xylose/arabinose/galactoside ABC-type transport system permease subunit